MGTSVAKIKSFTDSIVVDGKNDIKIQIEWEDKGSGDYESELYISIGNRKEYKYLNGDVKEYSFIIPVDWLNEIPASSIDSGKITINNIKMSDPSLPTETIVKRFIVYVPEEYKPSISNLSVDILDTQNHSVDYVLYGLTKPIMRAKATPHSTSPIKKWRITGGGIDVSEDFLYTDNGDVDYNFQAIGTVIRTWANTKFTLTIYDERGRSASIDSEEIYVQSYNRPLINSLSAYRTDKDGIAKADGGYIKVTVNAAACSIKNSKEIDINTLNCYVEWNAVNSSSYHREEITNKEPYIFEANKDLNYEIKCVVSDKFMQTVAYCNVIGDSKDFNIVDGGGGAAIGGKAAKGYFDVAYKSRFQKGISANEEVESSKGFVSTGEGSKGDFLSFGRATRIETMTHTVPDETTGSSYTVVDWWGDFNEYTDIGLYGVYYDNDVSSSNYYKVMNAPCEKAGTLRVYNATGNAEDSATEQYLMQEYVVYDGSAVYRRCLSKTRDSSYEEWPFEWTFGKWYCHLGVERGTSGAWQYEKRADGTAECWGEFVYSVVDGVSKGGNFRFPIDYPFSFSKNPIAFIHPMAKAYQIKKAYQLFPNDIDNTSKIMVYALLEDDQAISANDNQVSFYINVKGNWK